MRNNDFTEWLYGYCALSNTQHLNAKQLWIIKNHLNLVQAVDGHLNDNNRWLDEQIIALAKDNLIQSPPPQLVQEIFERYGILN